MTKLLTEMEARNIVEGIISKFPKHPEYDYEIVNDATIERPTCFVFLFQSSKFIKTGNFEDQLVGNSPILVDRRSGAVYYLATAMPPDHYIHEFETTGGISLQVWTGDDD